MCTHRHGQSIFQHTSRTHTNITLYKKHTKSKQLRSKSFIFLFVSVVTIAISHKISSPVVSYRKAKLFLYGLLRSSFSLLVSSHV
jgi:hypothetical protein